jgi:hypothetical protein
MKPHAYALSVLVAGALAAPALAQESTTINLTGVQFKNATNQSRTSAPGTISPARRYAYAVDGMLKGDSGLLKTMFPNPTPLAQVLESLSPGASAGLSGAVNNLAGTHPAVLLNKTDSGSSVVLGITVNYASTLTVGIAADNTAYFTLTNVTISPAFLVGSMTFTSGAAVITRVECPCDFNCDGFVDGIDYDQFNIAFYYGDMAADYNNDTFIDGIDYDLFNNAFAVGC